MKTDYDYVNIIPHQGELMSMDYFSDSVAQNVLICRHPNEDSIPYHTHDFFEFNYLDSGSCINFIENESISMHKGDIILMSPGTFHTIFPAADCRIFNFVIRKSWFIHETSNVLRFDSLLSKFVSKCNSPNCYKYIFLKDCADNIPITRVLDKLLKSVATKAPWGCLLQDSAMLEFLCTLFDNCEKGQLSSLRGETSEQMRMLISYVIEHYQTVSLDELSKQFKYSKAHICRLFTTHYGKAFNEIVTNLKIERAKVLLNSTNIPASEIALSIGYDSIEYFFRLFKRETGMTPKEYRKASKNVQKYIS